MPNRAVNDVLISFFFYDHLIVQSSFFYEALCARIQNLGAHSSDNIPTFLDTIEEWRRVAAHYVLVGAEQEGDAYSSALRARHRESLRRLLQLVRIDVDPEMQRMLEEIVSEYEDVTHRA